MKYIRENIQRYLHALTAAGLLLCTLAMPLAAVTAQAEEERQYQSISDSIAYGETIVYVDGIVSHGEHRGSMDWTVDGWFAEPWDLRLVKQSDQASNKGDWVNVDVREYRGHINVGDTIRVSATEHGNNGELNTWIMMTDRMVDLPGENWDMAFSSDTGWTVYRNFMPAGQYPDTDASKSWTAHNEYTVAEGIRRVKVEIYKNNDLDDTYVSYVFIFSVGKTSQTSTGTASEQSGEDSGTQIISDIVDEFDDPDLPGAIIISVGGAAAAGAAIASGGTEKKDSGEKKEKKKKKYSSRYKMYVYKDFGDVIRKDGKPVRVGARIAEITEDGEKPRNDLTKNIQVYSENDTLNVCDAGMSGKYKYASVTANPESLKTEGTVSFRYLGEGGEFIRNVIFRLGGDVKIVFPQMKEDGSAWIINANLNETDVIAGMGGKTRLRFLLAGALEEPENITFSNTTGFAITAVKDTEYSYTYWAEITNRTRKIKKTAEIFADRRRQDVTIRADFADKTHTENEFTINIWPDGISVPMEDEKDGCIEMNTIPDENAVGSAKIPPAMFNVYVCYMNGEEPVIEKNPGMNYTGFLDDGKYGNTFKEHFPWKVYGGAGISIYVYNTLPVVIEPYYAYLNLLYEGAGHKEEAKLPFRMIGIKPDLPSLARKEEALRKLRRAVQIFGLGSDPDLRNMVRNAPKMSGADIEHLTYQILLAGKEFYQAQSEEYASIDKVMTRYIVVASSLVAIGDKATEAAIKLYWPTAPADVIAAFANPFKNALAEYLGQYVARWSWVDLTEGGKIEEFAFMKTLVSSCNETLGAVLTGEIPMTPRVLGQFVSLYLMMSFSKHYFYGEGDDKGDIFKSLMAALGDLTLTKFKAFLGDKIKELGKKVLEPCGKYAGNLLSDQLRKGYQSKADTAGINVFMQYVRGSYKASGTLTDGANAAGKAAKEALKAKYMEGAEKEIEGIVDQAASAADIAIAQLLNYMFGGTLDENDALGTQTHEVLAGAAIDRSSATARLLARGFKKLTGIDVEKAYKDVQETLDISAKLDGAYLIIKMFGYCIEINYIENFENVFGIVYDAMFGWLEDLWKARRYNAPDFDPRNDLTDDTSVLERQAERVNNLEKTVNVSYYWK